MALLSGGYCINKSGLIFKETRFYQGETTRRLENFCIIKLAHNMHDFFIYKKARLKYLFKRFFEFILSSTTDGKYFSFIAQDLNCKY